MVGCVLIYSRSGGFFVGIYCWIELFDDDEPLFLCSWLGFLGVWTVSENCSILRRIWIGMIVLNLVVLDCFFFSFSNVFMDSFSCLCSWIYLQDDKSSV